MKLDYAQSLIFNMGKGYVPCAKCAPKVFEMMVLNKPIDKRLKNRVCEYPFPFETKEEFEASLKKISHAN